VLFRSQKQNLVTNASQSTEETSNKVSESLIEAITESLIQDAAPLEQAKESSSYELNVVLPADEDLKQPKDSEQFVSCASIQLTRKENIIEESSETIVQTHQDNIGADLVADPLEEFAYSKLTRTDSNLSSVSAKSNDTLKNKTANSLLELFNAKHVDAIEDHFNSLEEISNAIKQAGLETSQLIFGIDFTISNLENGTKTFNGRSLHYRDDSIKNPYQKVIEILGKTLECFDMDGRIPAFGFGDSKTKDRKVFPFSDDGYCQGFKDVLVKYNEALKDIKLSGPTNFAPLIKEAIKIVKTTKQYHILVIVADGQVTNERQTREAIVEASKYPISIIMVGVGDGPWDTMNEFDDSLPKRQFDNFQFVNYHEVTEGCENPDETFALHTLMEIPDQYKAIKELRLLEDN